MMPDREKVISGLHCRAQDLMIDLPACDKCDYQVQIVNRMGCDFRRLCKDALALLKEQEAKPPIHVHEEYKEHDWVRKENGDIDDFAYDGNYHNGPSCKRCHYSFCIFCDPDGWNKEPCIIDEYKCPKCRRYISKGTKFCSDCGQEVKWE